jgi:leucyl-tRNA synthetase
MSENSKIEAKWQKEWAKAKLFETEPAPKKQKYFMVFAYPTVSGTLHIGHARSYTPPDILARYKRARGFNVFFPLGFHATGVDCLKILEKCKEDPENGKFYGIPPAAAKKFKTPVDVAEYLQLGMIEAFKNIGLSLDYRPAVSTIHPQYNKFIDWQFHKLKEADLLIQRDYRVAWCPKEQHPVSLDPAEADVQDWKGAQIKDFIIIKFRLEDGTVLPAATLRPETVPGVTNLWLNPSGKYVKADIDGEKWIVAEPAIEKLRQYDKKISRVTPVDPNSFMHKNIINPATGESVPILPGEFVSATEATGVVMSVPAHDPFDYIYMKKITPEMKPIQVISVPGHGPFPAEELLAKNKITDPHDPRIEPLVNELYKMEFGGKMAPATKKAQINLQVGKPVPLAKKLITEELMKRGYGDTIGELSIKPVHCRCGEDIVVKKVSGQWFIDYGNEKWKERAKGHITKMNIFPPDYKTELPAIIDWLEARPCVRRRGLGTTFPFEKGWTIEALSDSTIYMAFYIVSKWFNAKKLKMDELTYEFFDYVFLGKGKAKNRTWDAIRKEFMYWYPLDLNAIGKEHKSVHLPFFVMNHVAIFPAEQWPLGISLNWHLIVEGEKMSKHLGNVVFWHDALNKYGADVVRFYIAHGANQWEDFNWKNDEVERYAKQLQKLYQTVDELKGSKGKSNPRIERWLKSRINAHIKEATLALDRGEIRKAADIIFIQVLNDLGWYRRRSAKYSIDWMADWLKMLAPFVPHTAEELWHRLGKKTFIIDEPWPEFDGKAISPHSDAEEELVRKMQGDIDEVKKLAKIAKPSKITLIAPAPWKFELYNAMMQGSDLKKIMSNSRFRDVGGPAAQYAQKLAKRRVLDELFLSAGTELETLRDAKEFLSGYFGCPVEVLESEKAANNQKLASKAAAAEPGRPGILVE